MKREASKLLNCLLSNKTCFKRIAYIKVHYLVCAILLALYILTLFLESGELNKDTVKLNVEIILKQK